MEYIHIERSVYEFLIDKLAGNDMLFVKTLHVQGMEVTQAIQYYRSDQHLTDPADRMPDNSATLIAGKPAWVRVYVRSGVALGDIAGVTGTLEVSRRNFGFWYLPIATLAPQPPGTVTARHAPLYTTERGALGYTLNFVIPADQMCGNLRLKATVTAPDGKWDEHTIYLDVTLRQSLSVRGIMVGYNGPTSLAPGAPNLVLAAPALADLQTTAAWTLLTYPVRSAATFASAGTITWNLPLTDPPSCSGCCSPNWVALNTAVQAQKVADGNLSNVLYYGLMANGIPMGPIIGCNSGGVSTGADGNQVTMAHELGHACGLPHAPCGVGGDPTYPAYEPYDPAGTPQASIGEYGLDISTGTIKPPGSFKDWMSYCSPDWISPHNHGKLVNNADLNPERVCVDHPWILELYPEELLEFKPPWPPEPIEIPWRRFIMLELEPVISLIGIVHAENEIEVKTVMRLDAVRQVPKGEETDIKVELIGKDKEVSDRAPLIRLPSQGCTNCSPCGDKPPGATYPYAFQAFLSDVETGTALRIQRDERELWVRHRPDEEPKIERFDVAVEGDRLVVGHMAYGAAEQVECWLQWSADKGETWRGLATGVQGDQSILDASALPAGPVLFRLLASDGFHTTVSQLVKAEMPERPPMVSILTPRTGQVLVAGGTMRLWGAVSTGSGDPVEEAEGTWILDGERIGEGLDLFVEAPPAGRHELVLEVTSGKQKTQARTHFGTLELKSGE